MPHKVFVPHNMFGGFKENILFQTVAVEWVYIFHIKLHFSAFGGKHACVNCVTRWIANLQIAS